jgi:hypothetical protein
MQIASAIGLKGFAVVKAAIDDEDDYTDSESVKGSPWAWCWLVG